MTEIKELVENLRARADFIARDTYDECWEVKETPQGAMLRQAASALEALISRSAVMEEALAGLENANNNLAKKRSHGVYLFMENELRDEMIALDEARRAARSALSLKAGKE